LIFLSYTWRHRPAALELDAWLRLAGFKVWIDHRNLRLEEDILFQLDHAIRDCDLFVPMTPRRHAGTPWMRTELGIARAYRKAILPYVAEPGAFASRLRARSARYGVRDITDKQTT
jgi:hypothetical protein